MADPAATPPADPADRRARRAAILELLAERGLELACDLQAAALATTEAPEKVRLALGFHHLSRTVRQTLALEERLERQTARDAREAAERADARAAGATAVRKARVQAGVERMIWTELEPQEAEAWTADLAERLDDEALEPGFTDEALDDHIDRAARELGLKGEGDREYLPRTLRRDAARRAAFRWQALLDDEAFDDDEDSDPEPPRDPPAVAAEAAPPPPAPPPPARISPPEPEPEPPPPTAVPEPPPEPPPRPYIPPWEQLRPGQSFPGGTGY